MPSDVNARIVLRGETREAVRELKKVQDAVKDLGNQVTSKKSLFKDFLGGLGIGAGFFGAQQAASALLNLGRAAITAGSDLAALERRAQVIYGDAFPRMTVRAEELGQTLHRSSSDILGTQAELSGIFTSAGIAGRGMEDMSSRL